MDHMGRPQGDPILGQGEVETAQVPIGKRMKRQSVACTHMKRAFG